MLQKSVTVGQHYPLRLLGGVLLLVIAQPTLAWDGASVAPSESPTHTDYNTILAEKISRTPLNVTDDRRDLFYSALNPASSSAPSGHVETTPLATKSLGTGFSAGWDLPLSASLSTGPVAQYTRDPPRLNCLQCEFSDPESPSQTASFGWRVGSQWGEITPWAQLSYSHQLSDSRLSNDELTNRQQNWIDVSIGAHLPLNNNLAAFASFSQSGALNSGEQFFYSLGVSASF